jgi:hypothetical protein
MAMYVGLPSRQTLTGESMSDSRAQPLRSLDEQRAEYARRRGLAMPLAGLIAWVLIGIAGAFLPPILAVWSLFIGTGFIAYLGMMLSRFTGENFLDRSKPKNAFDGLFFHCVAMALIVYAIAIPFFRVDYTSLPLTVGILAGLLGEAAKQRLAGDLFHSLRKILSELPDCVEVHPALRA